MSAIQPLRPDFKGNAASSGDSPAMAVSDTGALAIHPRPLDPEALFPFNDPTPRWNKAAERLVKAEPRVKCLFFGAANTAAFTAMLAMGAVFLWGIPALWPEAPRLWIGLACIVPAAQIGRAHV